MATPAEQRERDPSTAAWGATRAPLATRPTTNTAAWVHPSLDHVRSAVNPLRVDTDGAFAYRDHDTEEDRSVRAEATRRGPLPMPDLANEDGTTYVPEEQEQLATSQRDDSDFEPYDADQ
jgi:hypothetical protein